MASESINVPVIDFSSQDLKSGTPTWNSVKIEVRTAFEEFGCFTALYDKIPVEIPKALFGLEEELFDLPFENKARNSCNKPYNGYHNLPTFEGVGVEKATLPEEVKSFTDMMWPQGNSKFSKIILYYSDQPSELEKTVRRMVLESLSLEKYMEEHMDSTEILLRLMKYKAPQTNETGNVLAAHTDKCTLSILHQNEINGLEILTKDGNKFAKIMSCLDCGFSIVVASDLMSIGIGLRLELKFEVERASLSYSA